MAFRYSVEVRNAGLDARIKAVGPRPLLRIYSAPQTKDGGDVAGELVEIQLPADWMSKAEDGVVTSTRLWHGMASASGKARSYRIYDSAGKTWHIEGAIPEDMKLDPPELKDEVIKGQVVTVSALTIRAGNG